MSNMNRNPAGTPTGGQFAAGDHAEAEGVNLDSEEFRGELIPVVDRLDPDMTGVAVHGPDSWTGQVNIGDGPRVGVIYDSGADPLNPESDSRYRAGLVDAGDPLVVAWDDEGDIRQEGPSMFSVHQIPGMTEHLSELAGDSGGPAVPSMRQYEETTGPADGSSDTGWQVTDSYLGDVKFMSCRYDKTNDMAYLTVYDMDGNPVSVDGREHRPVGPAILPVDAADRDVVFASGEVISGKVAAVTADGTVMDVQSGTQRIEILVGSDLASVRSDDELNEFL